MTLIPIGKADKTGFLNLLKISFNTRLRNVFVLSALQNEFRRKEVLLLLLKQKINNI